jgi:hypothetical protein
VTRTLLSFTLPSIIDYNDNTTYDGHTIFQMLVNVVRFQTEVVHVIYISNSVPS